MPSSSMKTPNRRNALRPISRSVGSASAVRRNDGDNDSDWWNPAGNRAEQGAALRHLVGKPGPQSDDGEEAEACRARGRYYDGDGAESENDRSNQRDGSDLLEHGSLPGVTA